jgi:hypothetical protein
MEIRIYTEDKMSILVFAETRNVFIPYHGILAIAQNKYANSTCHLLITNVIVHGIRTRPAGDTLHRFAVQP